MQDQLVVLSDRAMMSSSIVDARIAAMSYGQSEIVGVAQRQREEVIVGHHLLLPWLLDDHPMAVERR
jgi:hypothetical protein